LAAVTALTAIAMMSLAVAEAIRLSALDGRDATSRSFNAKHSRFARAPRPHNEVDSRR
jgi:hypothetical protein